MGRIARRKRGFRDGKRMRILSMLFGNNSGGGASSILDGAPFKAQLITSLILNMGTGSPTYTRATTATFTDFEGVIRTAISGEARFQGARRVANLLTYTEDAANAAWLVSAAGSGSTPTKTTNYAAAPDGTTTAQRVQFNVGAGTASTDVSAFYQSPVCTTALNSVWIKSATGSDQKITLRARASSTVDDSNITATSTWTQISKLQTGGTAIFAMVQRGDWKTANTADILIWHPQCEDVTGQSVQTAGEYVSVGVLSSPYHGAGVDGVKYFSTTLAGLPISSSTAKYARLPGVAGSYFSTPDSVANSITGDIDIRVKAALTDWTPAAFNTLVAKRQAGGQFSFRFAIDTAGKLYFEASADGTASYSVTSGSATGFTDGAEGYVRATRVSSTGVVDLLRSADGVNWTSLTGGATTAGNIFDSTSIVEIGSLLGGTAHQLNGRIYQAQIFNGINGTLAVNFNANDYSTGTTWAASSTGETWTINGGATIFGAGASAPFDATGPKGYLSEGSRQNSALQSQALGVTTWAAFSAAATTGNNVVAPDGTTTATKVVEDATAASARQSSQLTITIGAGESLAMSVYVKRVVGTRHAYLACSDGTNFFRAVFNLDTVAVGNSSTGGTGTYTSGAIESLSNGWFRCTIVGKVGAASTSVNLFVGNMSQATDSTSTTYNGDGSSALAWWGGMLERNSTFASTYIPTTTVAVTRNADVLTYPSNGNVLGASGWAYAEIYRTAAYSLGGDAAIVGSGANSVPSVVRAGNLAIYDGTAYRSFNALTASQSLKVATEWAGSASSGAIGGVVASSGFDGDIGVSTNIEIGSYNSLNQFFGTIRNVRIGQSALSAGTLGNITT